MCLVKYYCVSVKCSNPQENSTFSCFSTFLNSKAVGAKMWRVIFMTDDKVAYFGTLCNDKKNLKSSTRSSSINCSVFNGNANLSDAKNTFA